MVRRVRTQRGLSQASLARLAGCSTRYVLDLEAGRVNPRLGDLLDIARALRTKLEALLSQDSRSDVAAGTLETEGSPAQRRQFFAWLAGMAGAAAVVDLERLAGLTVDETYLRDAETITIGLARQRSTVSPATLIPAAAGHLSALEAMLPATAELTARTGLLVGSLLGSDGRLPASYRVCGMVASLGSEAVRSKALNIQAWVHGQRGDSKSGLVLQDQAVRVGSDSSRLLAGLLGLRAELHAMSGNDLPAMRDLDAAQTSLSGGYEWYFFGPENDVELGAYRGTVLAALGRHREAVETFDWVLEHMDPSKVLWRQHVATDRDRALSALS